MNWDTRFVCLMAGPGTGKTYELMQTLAALLSGGAQPRRILAVTFTRVTASSLVKDLGDLDVAGCDEIRAGTLHAFCFSVLSRAEVFDYLGRVARPLITFKKTGGTLAFEAAPLLQDLNNQDRFGDKRRRTRRIREFEAAWARLQHDEPGWPQDTIDREFQRVLDDWLRFHRAMLIGELVPEALRYLRDNPGCRERTAFDHVIVDEYQDLNKADQMLIDLLSEEGRAFVVGDEDQSIYSFRFAHPDGIVEFCDTHHDTEEATLDRCRRCPTRVVAMADNLIRYNHPGMDEPRLRPKPENVDGEVHIVQWQSLAEEANGIAGYVRHLIDAGGYQAEDILILCPRRRIGYGIRDAIEQLRVPVHSFYHEEALEAEAPQSAFALLTLLADNEDRVALRYWLGYASPSWRAGEYARLRQACERSGCSPWETLEQLIVGGPQITGTAQIRAKFMELKARLAELAPLTLPDVVDRLFPEGDQNLETLRSAALATLDGQDLANLNAQWLLDKLRSEITQPELPDSGEFVRIMSLHRSKGLTSKVVIVTGCIHGLIPFFDQDETPEQREATLREQRRLFYVACTRPTAVLVLSYVSQLDRRLAHKIGATVRGGGRANGNTIASQFIGELGQTAPRPVRGSAWMRSGFR